MISVPSWLKASLDLEKTYYVAQPGETIEVVVYVTCSCKYSVVPFEDHAEPTDYIRVYIKDSAGNVIAEGRLICILYECAVNSQEGRRVKLRFFIRAPSIEGLYSYRVELWYVAFEQFLVWSWWDSAFITSKTFTVRVTAVSPPSTPTPAPTSGPQPQPTKPSPVGKPQPSVRRSLLSPEVVFVAGSLFVFAFAVAYVAGRR